MNTNAPDLSLNLAREIKLAGPRPGPVAQVSNLLYRRFAIGKPHTALSDPLSSSAPQVRNLRHSRLEICATLLAGLLAVLGASSASGRTIYVSKSGNDSKNGLTESNAVQTVSRAHVLASAGDILSIGSGVYLETPALTKQVTLVSRNGSAFVGACPSRALSVSAGANQQALLCLPTSTSPNPTATASLNGSAYNGCAQPLGSGQAHPTWSASGPGTVLFADAHQLATTAQFTNAGTYVLTLTVSDGALSSASQATVAVAARDCVGGPGTGSGFAVNAGPDLTGTTAGSVMLIGSVRRGNTNVEPPLVSVVWSNLSPNVGTVIFENPNVVTTRAWFSRAGTYSVRLSAKESDGQRRSGSDAATIQISTAPTTNCTLVVNAGPDLSLQRAAGSSEAICATLNGATLINGRATNGVPVQWTVPAGVTIDNSGTRLPRVCFPGPGIYTCACATRPAAGRCATM